ncbi:hypothetical protein LMG26857_03572 [Achromobacter anxifer]|uniref:hypothetical protein n=1 Tax=Achromobacter anxifer TaxID=1287737 RepID=UPI00155CFDF5|nr:hypothetical protein [Achromobacter anxifer]CAB5514513.1 hypothetical protein LMG26857_03572 [Achromobacter anxifer]
MSESHTQAPMTPEQFPTLRAVRSNPHRFDEAIDQVAEGLASDSIRNVVLQEVKFTLGNIVEEAWKKQVCEPHIYGKGKELPKAVEELFWSISLMCLHDVIATGKKVAKTKVEDPAVDAMRAYCKEVLPLAEAVAYLKGKVVKGRAASSAPAKPVNPNKVVKTCPVCFRPIAVVNGAMAHHGYQRPGMGYQTASCNGVIFPPLEVSNAGLVWLIGSLRKRLEEQEQAYRDRASKPEYLMARRERTGPLEKISRGDPMWSRLFSRYVAEIQQEIGAINHALPELDKRLAEWKPEAQPE